MSDDQQKKNQIYIEMSLHQIHLQSFLKIWASKECYAVNYSKYNKQISGTNIAYIKLIYSSFVQNTAMQRVQLINLEIGQ